MVLTSPNGYGSRMRPQQYPLALLLLAVGATANGCGDDDVTDRPTDYIPIDMGPRDAGRVVCEGTPQPCAEVPLATCDSAAGCYAGSCGGSPRSCILLDYAYECQQAGCDWDYEFDWCDGSAPRCESWGRDRSRCESAGCHWITTDVCEGSPPPCASLTRSECGSVPGCNLIGEAPPDLGTDAGPSDVDLGSPDSGTMGSMCPAGECDYGSNTGCPAGQACYLGTGGAPVCLSAGTAGMGETCLVQGDCVGGMVCLGSGDSGACHRICCGGDDSVCGAGSSCGAIQGIVGVGGCTLVCDPVAQSGCAAGEACYSLASGPQCAPPGTGIQGTTCTYQDDCSMGFGCVGDSATGYLCAEYCDPTSPSCSDPSLTCVPLLSSDAGVCLE